MRTLIVAFITVGLGFAQTLEEELRSKIKTVRYPLLAEQARISGDVHLTLNSSRITILSGHKLLAQSAVQIAKAFESIPSRAELDVTLHFAFPAPKPVTVKRGNAFERAVLRLFGLKAERVELRDECGAPAPSSKVKVAGAGVEVWIYGRNLCVETAAARR